MVVQSELSASRGARHSLNPLHSQTNPTASNRRQWINCPDLSVRTSFCFGRSGEGLRNERVGDSPWSRLPMRSNRSNGHSLVPGDPNPEASDAARKKTEE